MSVAESGFWPNKMTHCFMSDFFFFNDLFKESEMFRFLFVSNFPSFLNYNICKLPTLAKTPLKYVKDLMKLEI